MTVKESASSKRAWARKVDPRRAQTEQSRAERRRKAENVFNELFGPPDAALAAQMEASIHKLAAIGNHLPRWDATMPPAPAQEEA